MIRIVFTILIACQVALAQGWPTAAKNGFGTSTTLGSKVWFTLADGVMTEGFYPTVDTPSVQTLRFQVKTGAKIENEIDDTIHRLELPNPASLTFRQVNTAKSGQYTITKTYVTDPHRNSVLIDVQVESQIPFRLEANYETSSKNSGNSALVSNCGSKTQTRLNCTIVLGFGENLAGATNAARSSLSR